MNKDELLALLRVCNADSSAIEAVEMAYELGFKAGVEFWTQKKEETKDEEPKEEA